MPTPQPTEPRYDPEPESLAHLADVEVPEQIQPDKYELRYLHNSGVDDFLDADRMGLVRDREHVAGFQPHRFTKVPEVVYAKEQQTASWKIARLELVSLLKHDTPVAYVSKNLPQMDELRDAPTRPLDAFERNSIDRLRADEDVMIDETPDRIRMVGSLRAAKNCLDCHSVRRGELLGALTYELVLVRPTRKGRPQISPPSS